MAMPKVNVAPVPPGEHAAMYLYALSDQRAVGAYLDFFFSTLDVPPDDAQLVELARIRNAVSWACEY
jgi:hypothetical protein